MGADEFARVHGAVGKGSRATRPVTGPAAHDTRQGLGAEDDLRAPKTSVCAWEGAYRRYGRAWEWTARSQSDPAAAREMASASWMVAAEWRQIATATALPWWTVAALESAAAAFEAQARDYEARTKSEKP